jgi:biopolymer transport protein ExbD
MDLIPHDDLKPANGFNFAPMIDFLFLMLSLFATLALSRTALYDSEISLAELKPTPTDKNVAVSQQIQQINLTIDNSGAYQWITEFQQHPMNSVQDIQNEISRQYLLGALSKDKTKTEILLHIDQNAPWMAIANLIFAVKELGFSVHPVYEPIK